MDVLFIKEFGRQMLLCVLVGGSMGMVARSRGGSNNPRTFILITIGSALVTTVSIFFYKKSGLPWMADPGRLAAQVLSALGFLGTGMIWFSRDAQIRGLWTAAGLWVCAILGALIGVGCYRISVIGMVMMVIALLSMDYFESRKRGY